MKPSYSLRSHLDEIASRDPGIYYVSFNGPNGDALVQLRVVEAKGYALISMSTVPTIHGWSSTAHAYKRAYEFITDNGLRDARMGGE